MSRFLLSHILLVVLAAGTPAQQFLGGVLTPAVLNPGQVQTFTLTGTPASPGVSIDGLIVSSIHVGVPNGPIATGFGCGGCFGQVLGPGQSTTWTFAWPASLSGPLYYLRVDWWTTSTVGTEWYPVHVSPPGPTLLGAGPVLNPILRVGQTSAFWISGSACAGFPYIAAASSSTNTGIALAGGAWATLDLGTPLWNLSYPTPNPAIFGNFQGSLNSFGSALLTISVPNLPALANEFAAIQAAAITPGTGTLLMTNTLLFTILP